MNKVHFKAKILPKAWYLKEPELYKHIIILDVDPKWWQAVTIYGKTNKDKLKAQMMTMENWDVPYDETAKKFYFAVRDRLAEASGDTSREYKNHLHQEAKRECGYSKSINDLRRHELWEVTQVMIRWAEEAGADLTDLIPMQEYLRGDYEKD